MENIRDVFSNKLKLETYIQNFNVSNPFIINSANLEIEKKKGKNLYAFGRAQRADGTESIVISAPLYLENKNNHKLTPNLAGISELFMMAELAKSKLILNKKISQNPLSLNLFLN